MKLLVHLILAIWIVFPSELRSQARDGDKHPSADFSVSYTGDVVTNLSGGLEKGARYLGLANLRLGLDTRSLGLWRGGRLFVNVAGAHGGDPSADLIGDFHVVSNIETNDMVYLHELWYRQVIGAFEISVGLQDLNTEFVSTEYGSVFLNSTFGTPSTIASNVPSPIFPLTAVGASIKLNLPESAVKLAFFDGLPTSFTENPHNLRWSIDKEEGIFAIAEYSKAGIINNLGGNYRSGLYYHSRRGRINDEISGTGNSYNYGLYFITDQTVWKGAAGEEIGLFGQLAVSPRKINTHHIYAGAGLLFTGLVPGRADDTFGIAWNWTGMSQPGSHDESILELSYKAVLSGSLYIQPDLQYIINPSGTEFVLKNALAASLRIGMNFRL